MLTVAGVSVVCAVSVVAIVRDSPSTLDVRGTVRVVASEADPTNPGCAGIGDFKDVHDGTSVTIEPYPISHDRTVFGTLLDPQPVGIHGSACSFALSVPDVPDGFRQYEVRIGERQPKVFDGDELSEPLRVTLGHPPLSPLSDQ